uniref:Uncharacterized protein n=1 Tax=Arundo donax TaxID=35708 RepID=A0A0A9F8Y3_ARUDO
MAIWPSSRSSGVLWMQRIPIIPSWRPISAMLLKS